MKKSKRILSVALAMSLAAMPMANAADYEGDYSIKRYPGEAEYRQKFKNINFRDIRGHWSKDAVYTMGALGIAKGTGLGTFVPENSVTKEEVLLLIVRLMGLEDEAQIEAQNMMKSEDTAGYNVLDPYHYMVKGTISVAESAGIIDPKELPNINPITEATKASIERDVRTELQDYENRNLTESQLKNIENALREKYTRNYTWKGPATREVAAYWMGRALTGEDIAVNSHQAVSTFIDGSEIREDYVSHIEVVVRRGYIKGDNLNRFNPQGRLTRSQMAQMVYNAHEEKLGEQGYIIDSGKIVNIQTENGTDGGEAVRKRIVQIRNSDNETIEIYEQAADNYSNYSEKYDKGIVTYSGGELSEGFSKLEKGDTVRYYIRPNGEAVFAVEASNDERKISGKLVAKYDDFLLIEGYNGEIYRYRMSKDVDFSVNGSWTEIDNLVPGMQGYYYLMDGKVFKAEVTVPEGGLGGGGNIDVGDYFDTGIVVSKSLGNSNLTVSKDGGTLETYDLSPYPNLPIYRDGVAISLSDIKDGDSIAVYFSDTDRSIAKIVISPHKTRAVEHIYKGRIFYYNRNRGEIRLGDGSRIDSTSMWEAVSGEKTLKISDRADIYATDEGGTTGILISRDSFEDYATYKEQQTAYIENALNKETDIYLYTEVVNGAEEITRIVLKGTGEYKYGGVVETTSNGMFSLPSNKNIQYDNSTIVVKEGRLVNTATIKPGDTLTVYTHNGRSTAAIVFIEGIDMVEYPYTVYSTRVVGANMISQSIDVSGTGGQKVNGSEASHAPIETLNLPTDSVVKHLTMETGTGKTVSQKISTDEFFARYYKDYENARLKIVADKNRNILEIQIYSEPLNRPELEDIRTAKVAERSPATGMFTLTDVRTWTGSSWSGGVSSMTFDFTNAIVISNGRATSIDRIPEGASIDVITDVNTGHTIIVR